MKIIGLKTLDYMEDNYEPTEFEQWMEDSMEGISREIIEPLENRSNAIVLDPNLKAMAMDLGIFTFMPKDIVEKSYLYKATGDTAYMKQNASILTKVSQDFDEPERTLMLSYAKSIGKSLRTLEDRVGVAIKFFKESGFEGKTNNIVLDGTKGGLNKALESAYGFRLNSLELKEVHKGLKKAKGIKR